MANPLMRYARAHEEIVGINCMNNRRLTFGCFLGHQRWLKKNILRVGARMGHGGTPAYAMQCQHQFVLK